MNARAYRMALREAQRRYPDVPVEELDEEADGIMRDWVEERAHDREQFGEAEDSPCLEDGVDNCNDWGTGEGRFHGRIG